MYQAVSLENSDMKISGNIKPFINSYHKRFCQSISPLWYLHSNHLPLLQLPSMIDAFVFHSMKWEKLCMKNAWRRKQFPFQHHLLINEKSTGFRQGFIILLVYIHVTRIKPPSVTAICFLLKSKNYQQQVNTLSVGFFAVPMLLSLDQY